MHEKVTPTIGDIVPIPPGSAADRFFLRQQDLYSCGPACFATIWKIYDDQAPSYETVRAEIGPDPEVGVPTDRMAAYADKYMKATAAGEKVYDGGIAMANVTQDHQGHYVVFLCREGDKILYYDPEYHELVIAPENEMRWYSKTEGTERWTVNFPALPDNSFDRWLKMAAAPQPKQACDLKPGG